MGVDTCLGASAVDVRGGDGDFAYSATSVGYEEVWLLSAYATRQTQSAG